MHGYEEWGDDLLRARRHVRVRDLGRPPHDCCSPAIGMGKKPLYLSERTMLAFGSDARSVLLASGGTPTLDEDAVAEFLFQRYVSCSAHALPRRRPVCRRVTC